MQSITIPVTQAHIDKGLRNNPQLCVIALAARDVLPLKPGQYVGVGNNITIWNPDMTAAASFYLPPEARELVAAFDSEQPVQPLTFTAYPDTRYPHGTV